MAYVIANGCGAVHFDAAFFEKNEDLLTLKDGVVSVPNATTTTAGIVKQSTNIADVTGANPTAAEFNALLAALKTAGIMANV